MLPYRVPSSSAKGAVLSFLDVTALHELSRLQSVMDALDEHIAVLNSEGVITQVNKAWERFAIDNGDPQMLHTGPGTNYLAACKSDTKGQVYQGIRDVLQRKSTHFSIEYPCHSKTEERWFVMHVTAFTGQEPGAVVSHTNITHWRQLQKESLATSK
jgi:two-component system, chemotaxis family, CheB/CheR fusion protein